MATFLTPVLPNQLIYKAIAVSPGGNNQPRVDERSM